VLTLGPSEPAFGRKDSYWSATRKAISAPFRACRFDDGRPSSSTRRNHAPGDVDAGTRAVARGEAQTPRSQPPMTASRLSISSTRYPVWVGSDLSSRVRPVVWRGISNRAIGESRGPSTVTVRHHGLALMGKIRASIRTQAVALALRSGSLRAPDLSVQFIAGFKRAQLAIGLFGSPPGGR
jgi:hypothetical protein